MFLSLFGVDHFPFLVFFLKLLCLLELVLYIGVIIFKETGLIEINSFIKFILCRHCTSFAGKSLAELLIIIVALLALLDCLIALFNALLVILHLIVCGSLVIDVSDLILIKLEGFIVFLESLSELLLLVELVSLVLDSFCLLLAGNPLLFLG